MDKINFCYYDEDKNAVINLTEYEWKCRYPVKFVKKDCLQLSFDFNKKDNP